MKPFITFIKKKRAIIKDGNCPPYTAPFRFQMGGGGGVKNRILLMPRIALLQCIDNNKKCKI